jgi:hypothetical protein
MKENLVDSSNFPLKKKKKKTGMNEHLVDSSNKKGKLHLVQFAAIYTTRFL